ncbi:hypothetical protein [Namhaeicola litoreus]|uniref:AraC effector-binding domain-containing protein n=1 Tax=Namhaeicola litoreus TaxID=1052145 RepID=A0ABW3XY86_9FLAO
MTAKKILLFAVGLVAFWYLFLKQSDYIIRFKLPTSPGVAYALIKDWGIELGRPKGAKIKFLDDQRYHSLQLELKNNNRIYNLYWKLKPENDSVTNITLGFKEPGKTVLNRIIAPFYSNEFKKNIVQLSTAFKEGAEQSLSNKFKVNEVILVETPQLNYAYVDIKNVSVFDKAEQMMKHNYELIHQVDELGILRKGYPFVMVKNWNLKENKIDYRLCIQIDSVVQPDITGALKFDQLLSKQALKTIYNGNYIYSDKAWFALHDYAIRQHFEVDLEPIEIFHNNPFTDTKEMEWETEVFLPLSQ